MHARAACRELSRAGIGSQMWSKPQPESHRLRARAPACMRPTVLTRLLATVVFGGSTRRRAITAEVNITWTASVAMVATSTPNCTLIRGEQAERTWSKTADGASIR